MFTIRVDLTDKVAWKEALRNAPHTAYHTYEYNLALSRTIASKPFLWVFKNEESVALCVLCGRQKIRGWTEIYTPYGFGGIYTESKNFMQQCINELDRLGRENDYITGYIMQHPWVNLSAEIDHKGYVNHKPVFDLNISRSSDELWENLRKGHKYEIRKAQKAQRRGEVSLMVDKEEVLQGFMEIYRSTMNRVGASSTYGFSDETIRLFLDIPGTIIIGAQQKGRILAAAIFLRADRGAEYFLSGSTEDGKGLTRLVIWEAIKLLKEAGVMHLHLGGGIQPGDSLEDFKRRFGGSRKQLGLIKIVFDSERYHYLCKKFNCDPTRDRDFFPPYWKY